jgi:hypothetical protein
MKRVMQLVLLVAWISLLVLFHVSYISASSIGGPPPGGRDTGGRNSGSGQDAVGTKQPARNPARTIVVPTIVVNEALLKRLSSQPVQLPRDLSPAQRNGLEVVARHLNAGNMGAARAQWSNLLRSYVSGNTQGSNIMAMIYYCMQESIKQNNETKKYVISKLESYNTISDALTKHLKELAEASRNLAAQEKNQGNSDPARGKIKTVDVLTIVGPPPGAHPGSDNTLRWAKRRMDRTTLQGQIRYVERRLAAVGDDAQLANRDLQTMLQKQQQTMQAMSQISKILHDTAMAVIRKIGG